MPVETDDFAGLSIAVLLPCHNEAPTVGDVVRRFRAALPQATVYVFDNASSDDTARRAALAGARVYREPRKGKGNVVRRMFADVDADIYVMADGDGTYDPADAPTLIANLLGGRVDMVVGTRKGVTADAGRSGHGVGNLLFNGLYRHLFGDQFSDIFSGYRVFSRRFVKSFPAISSGFEIETEMSVHASQLGIPTLEVPLDYGRRPEGSKSKLNSVRDGMKILLTFVLLLKETRPVIFFGLLSAVLALTGLILALPIFATWLETGLVPRFPTAMLSTGLMLLAALSAACGLILDSLTRARIEQKRILYLAVPALRAQ
jgi:glycosyltransferase involved in cell wall biosynthesis